MDIIHYLLATTFCWNCGRYSTNFQHDATTLLLNMVRNHANARSSSTGSDSSHHGAAATHMTSVKEYESTLRRYTSKTSKANHHSISETGEHTIAIDTVPLPVFTSTTNGGTLEKTHIRTHTLRTSLATPSLLPPPPQPRLTLSTAVFINASDNKPAKTSSTSHQSTGLSAKEDQHLASTKIALPIIFTLLVLSVIAFMMWKCLRPPSQRQKWKSWFKCCRCCFFRPNTRRSPPTSTTTASSGAVFSESRQDFMMTNLHSRPGTVDMPPPPIPTVPYSNSRPDTSRRQSEVSGNIIIGI